MITYKTTDLRDAYGADLQVAEPLFRDFGGVSDFWSEIVTLKVADDNSLYARHSKATGMERCWSWTAAARCAARYGAINSRRSP